MFGGKCIDVDRWKLSGTKHTHTHTHEAKIHQPYPPSHPSTRLATTHTYLVRNRFGLTPLQQDVFDGGGSRLHHRIGETEQRRSGRRFGGCRRCTRRRCRRWRARRAAASYILLYLFQLSLTSGSFVNKHLIRFGCLFSICSHCICRNIA